MTNEKIKKFTKYVSIVSFIVILLTMFSNGIDNNVTMENLTLFLNSDITDKREFHSPGYDCDYFSIDLAKNASEHNMNFGIAILEHKSNEGYHAVNYVYVNDSIIFIEPQTDGIFNAATMSNIGYISAKLIPWRTPTARFISYKPDIYF